MPRGLREHGQPPKEQLKRWRDLAKETVQDLMTNRSMTHGDLAKLLRAEGFIYDSASLTRRLTRGSYPTYLLLAIMKVLGVKTLDVQFALLKVGRLRKPRPDRPAKPRAPASSAHSSAPRRVRSRQG
jgi:hypothetical protein